MKLQLHPLYTSGLKELFARARDGPHPDHRGAARPGRRDAGARAAGLGRRARAARRGARGRCASAPAPLRLQAGPALEALEAAGMPWELAVDSISCSRSRPASIADLAVSVQLPSAMPARCEAIRHGGALPELPEHLINMYVGEGPRAALAERLAAFVRQAYGVADCGGRGGVGRRPTPPPPPCRWRARSRSSARPSFAASSGRTWLTCGLQPAHARARRRASRGCRAPRPDAARPRRRSRSRSRVRFLTSSRLAGICGTSPPAKPMGSSARPRAGGAQAASKAAPPTVS